MSLFVLNDEICHVYRVDGDPHAAAAAAAGGGGGGDRTRQTSLKHAETSHCEMAVTSAAVSTNNISGSVKAPEQHFEKTDNGRTECEYSSSMKIGSSFVADSLAPDVIQNEEADVVMSKHSSSDEQMQEGRSSDADMDCEAQTSDDACLLEHASQLEQTYQLEQISHSQQPVAEAHPANTQTGTVTVTPVTSSSLTHSTNMVSIMFTVCTLHFFGPANGSQMATYVVVVVVVVVVVGVLIGIRVSKY